MSRPCHGLTYEIGVVLGFCPPTGEATGPPQRPKAKQPPGDAATSRETGTVGTFHEQGAM
jgi:hypothetical protein